MVHPQTWLDKLKSQHFFPGNEVYLMISVAFQKFDAVQQVNPETFEVKWNKDKETGELKGGIYDNLRTVTEDCKAIRKAGAQYNFKDEGLNGMYRMLNPTFKQWVNVKLDINRRCKENPETGHIILSCFAGHGMLKNGKQILLTNEFDSNRGFYK